MTIAFTDLRRDYRELGAELLAAFDRVLRSGRFILGEELDAFEREFSDYLGTRYSIGVNSGSDAIYLALVALGISPGDEVITVSHTFVSTVDAIIRCGARPVFVDVDERNYCMEATAVEDRITSRTRAILPVHLYGHPAHMDPILALARKHGLAVVEDACQAHGALYQGNKVGSLGDVGCFSFYPTKNLGGYGDAGMAVSSDEGIANRIRMLRNYGQRQKHESVMLGFNSRLDELQAAVLRAKLARLDAWNAARRRKAELYRHHLGGTEVILPREEPYARHVYHLYVIRARERRRLMEALALAGIDTAIHYPLPVHRQASYKDAFGDASLPVTEKICDEILSLPMHPSLEDEEIVHVAEAVAGYLSREAGG